MDRAQLRRGHIAYFAFLVALTAGVLAAFAVLGVRIMDSFDDLTTGTSSPVSASEAVRRVQTVLRTGDLAPPAGVKAVGSNACNDSGPPTTGIAYIAPVGSTAPLAETVIAKLKAAGWNVTDRADSLQATKRFHGWTAGFTVGPRNWPPMVGGDLAVGQQKAFEAGSLLDGFECSTFENAKVRP